MKSAFLVGSFYGATGVMLGAFGAHGLRPILPQARFEAFQTAVQYQLLHAVVLIAFYAAINSKNPLGNLAGKAVIFLWSLGTLLFSGSIYVIVLVSGAASMLWFLTPLGGVLLISGWLTAFFGALANRGKTE